MKKTTIFIALTLFCSQLLSPISSVAEGVTQNDYEKVVNNPTTDSSLTSSEELTSSINQTDETQETDVSLQGSSEQETKEITENTEESTNNLTPVPEKSAAYSIDGVIPQVVSQVNSYSMVSLAYSGKGQSLEDYALPSNTLSLSIKIVNFSNTDQVIPAGTKINFSASESQGLLTSSKLLKTATFFSSDTDQNLSAITETDGSISILFNSDFYPGENISQLILMYQDPGYNWDNSGATNNPTMVDIQLTSTFKNTNSTTEIQSMPLYLKPNKKSDSNTGGGVSGFALPGPASPVMTSPGYSTDKQGAGGGYFYYVHDPAALDSSNNPYFSYTTGMNLLVWGRQNGGALEHTTKTHPFDVDATRLYVQNIDGSIEDITSNPGVSWISKTPNTIKVNFVEFSKNNPNAKQVFLRTYVPVNSLMDTNLSYQTAFNDGGQTVNGSWGVTSVFGDPLSSSNTPYFRGTDLTVYDTDRTSATDSLYANIGTSRIDSSKIIVTDFDGYPDFASTSTGADVTAKPGVYNISYSVTSGGVTTDFTRKITVLKNQTALNVTDSTIYKGSSWSPQDNFANALDKDGNTVTFDKITTSGTVDVNSPGVYTVTYTYGSISSKAKIKVVENQETLAVKNSILYTGSSWTAKDNFISATDTSGTAVEFNEVTTKGSVDTTTPGNYEITYSYGDLTKIAMVTVVKDQSQIVTKDSTIYVGDSWSAKDNFVSATNQDGSALDFSKIAVSGSVDTSKAGKNTITYTYNNQKTTAQVTVIENKQSLVVKNSKIYIGDDWENQDNFVSATDKDGKTVDFSAIKVTGSVDVNTVGEYTVVYTNGDLKKLAVITVSENQQSITGADFSMYVGDKEPTPSDFNASATDKDGKSIEVKTDFSGVNFAKAGTYDVVLTSADGQTKTVKLTVKENHQLIDVKDSTLYLGDAWKAQDNFVSATDKEGQDAAFSEITVTGNVDTSKAGVYPVTYTNGTKKAVATITVLAKPGIEANDKTMYVGDTLTKEDILSWATFTNAEGYLQGFEVVGTSIPVSSSDKLTTVGEYKIKYYVEGKTRAADSRLAEKEITLTVIKKTTGTTDPEDPTKAIDSGSTKPTNAATGNASSSKSLPSTGEQQSNVFYAIGSLLMVAAGALYMWIKKEKQKK